MSFCTSVVKDSCPPTVENAQVVLLSTPSPSGSESYTIECDEGFRTMENFTEQIYICENQQTWLPCIGMTSCLNSNYILDIILLY